METGTVGPSSIKGYATVGYALNGSPEGVKDAMESLIETNGVTILAISFRISGFASLKVTGLRIAGGTTLTISLAARANGKTVV